MIVRQVTTPKLASVCCVLVAAARLADAQWCPAPSPPAPLNANAAMDSGFDSRPAVATDGDGRWIAAWSSTENLDGLIGTDRDILFAMSEDDGLSWSPPDAVNTNAGADSGWDLSARIVTDGAGVWIVVWDSRDDLGGTIGTDDDILCSVSSDHGETWGPPGLVNTNAAIDSGTDERPQIVTDGAGRWLVAWHSSDDLGGSIGTDRDVLFALSTDDGATWSPPAALNTNAALDSGWDTNVQLDTDGSGTWFAAWHSSDDLNGTIGTDYDILFTRSLDRGSSWLPPEPLNDDAARDASSDTLPSLATDATGSLVAVWKRAGRILSARSEDSGMTWSAAREIGAETPGSFDAPHIATDGAGAWAAVWHTTGSADPFGPDQDILYATTDDAGDTWSPVRPLNTNAIDDEGGDSDPFGASDGAGRWLVVWRSTESLGDEIGGDFDILQTRFALPDCNANGLPDAQDIADGISSDGNGNGVPDECEIDSDGDGVHDGCDNCHLYNPDQADCQLNGIGDLCDIGDGTSPDCDGNGVPDECQDDCDGNGVPNVCQVTCSSYTITDLGLLDGDYTAMTAHAVNDLGHVVGRAHGGPSGSGGFVWRDGVLSELPPLAGEAESLAEDINDGDVIVGWSHRKPFFITAVRWDEVDGSWAVQQVFTLAVSRASAVNDAGQIAGFNASDFCPDPDHRAWRQPGSFLPSFELGAETEAWSLNELGQVVGSAELNADTCWTDRRAVLWDTDGQINDLGTLGGSSATAYGVNAAAHVVGSSRISAACCDRHAFIWLPAPAHGLPAGLSDLGTCGGDSSEAFGINEQGLVVGQTEYPSGLDRAFVWAAGITYDLNDLIPDDSGWTLTRAVDINDVGQIVGSGVHDGASRAFLLTPVLDADVNGNSIPDDCECIGDVDRDGTVDVADLSLVILSWGPAPPGDPADVNGDGDVGAADLVAVILAWGVCW